MRTPSLLTETLATVRGQKVPTIATIVLVAVMCTTVLATVGRTAASELQVAQRLDAAGSRQLTITDISGDQLLGSAVVDQALALSTVDQGIAHTHAQDAVAGSVGPGGDPIPLWRVTSELSDVAQVVAGRWPAAGEAIVSQTAARTLGFEGPAGFLTAGGDEYAVVGIFHTLSPFDAFDAGALVPSPDAAVTTLRLVVADATQAASTQTQVLRLIAPTSPDDLQVTSPATLAQVQQEVAADVTSFGRGLLLLVLAAGGILVAVVVLSDVLVRRKDLGRRRALGATRSAIILLVVGRTLAPAVLGALVGTAAGTALALRAGAVPPPDFIAATGVLATLTAVLACLLPAALAAYRDPVAVLRTP